MVSVITATLENFLSWRLISIIFEYGAQQHKLLTSLRMGASNNIHNSKQMSSIQKIVHFMQ